MRSVLAGLLLLVASWAQAGTTIFASSASKTVANTTTETTLLPATVTIPANNITAPGAAWRVDMWGVYNATVLLPTLDFRVKVGGSTLSDTGAVATISASGAAQLFHLSFVLQFRVVGASAQGILVGAASLTNTVTTATMPLLPTLTVLDMTAARALDITAQWGTANAGNSIRADITTVELVDNAN